MHYFLLLFVVVWGEYAFVNLPVGVFIPVRTKNFCVASFDAVISFEYVLKSLRYSL